MERKHFHIEEGIYVLSGIALIAFGVICNEWLMTKVLSRDGVLQTTSKIRIYLFQIATIVPGILLITYRKATRPGMLFRTLYRARPRMTKLLCLLVFLLLFIVFLESVFLP